MSGPLASQNNQPSYRRRARNYMTGLLRKADRGVPHGVEEIEDPEEQRAACVQAGMPAWYNDDQMACWYTGDKLRGPGITRTPTRKQRQIMAA